MKGPGWLCAGLLLAAALPAAGAVAQIEGLLGKGEHGTGLKGMAGMASSPLTSGSVGNVAGLLQFCIGNNYLSGGDAASVKDQLLDKLPTGAQTQDRGYTDGAKGMLHGSHGNLMNLAGGGDGSGGLTADLTKKACETILAQGKSFL